VAEHTWHSRLCAPLSRKAVRIPISAPRRGTRNAIASQPVRVARNCRRIILQNFYGTLIVDTIGIGLAAAGFLNPLLATFIHVASELTFILNSTRLLPPRQKNKIEPTVVANAV